MYTFIVLPCAKNEKSIPAMAKGNLAKTVSQTTLQEVETHSETYVLIGNCIATACVRGLWHNYLSDTYSEKTGKASTNYGEIY